jgi:hypothetical protein
MVADHDAEQAARQGGQQVLHPRDLPGVDAAVGPVELQREAPGRVDADHRDLVVLEDRLDLRRDVAAVAAVRVEEALDQVVGRDVVVAGTENTGDCRRSRKRGPARTRLGGPLG